MAELSTCLVARAFTEPPAAAAWRLGVLRFGKQRPAPRLLCSGWDLFTDAPGPAALLVIPPNLGIIGWSFAAVPLIDAFSAEATQLGDAADSPASLMAHYAALGAHVLPHELAEHAACACVLPSAGGDDTGPGLPARVVVACGGPAPRVVLARLGVITGESQWAQPPGDAAHSGAAVRPLPGASLVLLSSQPPWACDDANTLTLVHTRTMGQATLSLGATHAVPMALPPAGCAASLAILARASSADATVPMDVDAPAALMGACTHSGTVLGCTLHMLDTAKAAAALDPGPLSVSDSPAMSTLADAVALRAAAAATETRHDEHKLHLKLGLAQTARDALRACATRPATGMPAAQVHGCFCGGEYVVTAALEGGCTMESASLLLLCDAGTTVAVGRATHTQSSAVPHNSSTQLTCAVPAAAVAAQPRGSALHVVLTVRMEGDAPDAPPMFHHLGRLVPDWSTAHGQVAAGVPHGMDIARHVHLRSPPGGSDLRQLARLLRAALRLEVHDARDSSHALVLEVPPGHELLPPGSHVTVCSLTAQRGEVALAARLACEVDVLQAAVAACLPPDVMLSSAVGSDAALRDARSLADAILQELRCDDAERLLQVQARTDAACARVVQALCLT